jgi:hypothetical protein
MHLGGGRFPESLSAVPLIKGVEPGGGPLELGKLRDTKENESFRTSIVWWSYAWT